MCYTTGPDDFYVRTSELHEQFDAITAQMNEYYKVDRHRKPASADMVGRSEVCAIQSWKTLDWRRIVCIQVLHDSSIFELIDSGERFELQVEEMWRLKAIPKVGSMSSLLSIPPVCVHCRLVNQQKVPEHMWQYLCENDLKMAFTILVHHVGQVEGQATEVEIMGLG
uniref:Tudor domain-containing protein n=1 Tax=Plectus sambesii TaxID=2011161 RepID=A0A914WVY2_9BILA